MSCLCLTTDHYNHRTGVSRCITSSMSSPYSTWSQEPCSNKISAFRLEDSSGNGFDPLWAGPNAMNVPKAAITIDDLNPDVVLFNSTTWSRSKYSVNYGGTILWTTQPGASLNFSFDGVAIWYDCVLIPRMCMPTCSSGTTAVWPHGTVSTPYRLMVQNQND